MPEQLRPIVRRVARHEAGHYVVGRILGFEVGDCTATILDMNGGHRGGSETTLGRPLVSLEQVEIYLQHRVQVLYAGALAESLSQLGKVDNDLALNSAHKGGAQDDRSKARELIHLIRNLRYPEYSSRNADSPRRNRLGRMECRCGMCRGRTYRHSRGRRLFGGRTNARQSASRS